MQFFLVLYISTINNNVKIKKTILVAKEVIRSHKSKDRQNNSQKEKRIKIWYLSFNYKSSKHYPENGVLPL